MYVCDGCNEIEIDVEPTYLFASRCGPFCADCVLRCKSCDEPFAIRLDYLHRDCARSRRWVSRSESESDGEDEPISVTVSKWFMNHYSTDDDE